MASSPNHRRELAVLCEIAQAAGRAILDVYGSAFTSWQKDDDTPLTQADLRADAVIRQGLERAFPGVWIWSEESRSASTESSVPATTFFLVDPLDGTREFLRRNDEFTVNIALIQNGRPSAGVVYAPALGQLYSGVPGRGAWRTAGGATVQLATHAPGPGEKLRVIGSRSHGGEALKAWLAGLQQPCDFVVAGSALKFCRLAEGAADVYPRLGPTSQWDTAAGQAVLEAAGGVVVDPTGAPLRYGLDRPALNPNFLALTTPDLAWLSVPPRDPANAQARP